MRLLAGSEMPSMLPDPGTTEAIEFGCTCRVIAHQSATDEAEPAEMLTVRDANCPLHAIPIGATRPTEGSSLQCDGGPVTAQRWRMRWPRPEPVVRNVASWRAPSVFRAAASRSPA